MQGASLKKKKKKKNHYFTLVIAPNLFEFLYSVKHEKKKIMTNVTTAFDHIMNKPPFQKESHTGLE